MYGLYVRVRIYLNRSLFGIVVVDEIRVCFIDLLLIFNKDVVVIRVCVLWFLIIEYDM